MNELEVKQEVLECISKVYNTPVELIAWDEKMENQIPGADSLMLIETLIAIHQKLNCDISEEIADGIKTPKELYEEVIRILCV